MKKLKETPNKHHWPRCIVESIECRRRDLVVRIADWTRQSIESGEPAFDVEIYVGGVYDWTLSKAFCLRNFGSKGSAKRAAVAFAQSSIDNLL